MLKKPAFHIIIVSLILFLLGWYLASLETFFSSDSGLRFMQVRQLVEHNWRTFAIDYPQQTLDPYLEHVPYYYAYSVIDGEIYFDISHVYPLLVSFFYSLLGIFGLPIVAIAGGVLTAVAIYKLAQLTQLTHPKILIWATIFATPVLFYSLELWDHTLATACATVAVYGIAKAWQKGESWPAFWSGMAAGFGLAHRPEMYLFTIVLGVSVIVFVWQQKKLFFTFLFGGILSTFVVWGLHYLWVGHPFGLAFASNFFQYGTPDNVLIESTSFPGTAKYMLMLFYVQPGSVLTLTAMLLVTIGIFLIVFSLRLESMRRPIWLSAGGAACVLGYFLLIYYARYGLIPGVISTFPLIALSLVYVGEGKSSFSRIYRFVLFVALLFLVGMVLTWPAVGGRQWGARYLLPVYPLLLYSAYYTYDTLLPLLEHNMQKTLRHVALGLLTMSVVIQLIGLNALYVMRQSRVGQYKTVAHLHSTIIVTDATQAHIPSVLTFLADKQFLQTGDKENQQTLFIRLEQEHVPQFGYLTRADQGVPQLPENSCYELDESLSFKECGRESSCWVFHLSPNCD